MLSKDSFWSIHIHSALLGVVLICLVLSFKSAFSLLIKKQIMHPILVVATKADKNLRYRTVRITQLPHLPGKQKLYLWRLLWEHLAVDGGCASCMYSAPSNTQRNYLSLLQSAYSLNRIGSILGAQALWTGR